MAVARAMIMEPEVLLMDAPLTNLDALPRLQFRAELKKLVKDTQTTTLYVTHDQAEREPGRSHRRHARRSDPPGRPAHDGVRYPAKEFVGSFIGNPPMSFCAPRCGREQASSRVAIGDQGLAAPAEGRRTSGDDMVLLGIMCRTHPGEFALRSPPNGLEAEALVVEPLGSHLLCLPLALATSGSKS